MSRLHVVTLAVVASLVLALPACGGGGQGYRVADNPIAVASTSIPSSLSGEPVKWEIPLVGGCGGPYVMKVVGGKLPPGLALDNGTHSIVGVLLDDGSFEFSVQIDDTGCNPFSSTVASFRMVVGVGAVTVVDVLSDGNPSLTPTGGTDFNPDYPALPTAVYNDSAAFQFVVAGGVSPYTMKLYDDPGLPDADLPLGVVIPSSSPNLVGSPVEVGPNGGPFLLSFEIVDAVGAKGYFTCYWKIDTPPIIIASTSLNDGVCGQSYSDQFFTVDGVPPFVHEFSKEAPPAGYTSDVAPNNADVVYNPGAPPTVTPSGSLTKIDAWIYPAPGALGPNYDVLNAGSPPEGMVLTEATGAVGGIPRRRGNFSVNYHVSSLLVPNSFGQHAWATFTTTMTPSGSLAQIPTYTLEDVFSATPPYATLPELEKGVNYDPDGLPAGLQFLAAGGVPQDGKSDHPHKSQTDADPAVGETAGAYTWTVNWDPDGVGTTQVPFTEFLAAGILRVQSGQKDNLVPQGFQNLSTTVIDYALPTSLAGTYTAKLRIAVGPDTVVITESALSFTGGNTTSADSSGMNDTWLKVKILLPLSGGATTRALDNAKDLSGTGSGQSTIPATAGSGTTLAAMLGRDATSSPPVTATGTDLLRVAVNPGGWWNDTLNLDPKGARGFQHGDANQAYGYNGHNYAYDYYYAYGGYTYKSVYGANPESTCVDLPDVTTSSVTENKANAVYKSGGKMYVFDSPDYIGAFIIRKDAKIYVPMAFQKSSSGYRSFGDHWGYATGTTGTAGHALFKLPQLAVSPDGRFGAMKVSTSNTLTWDTNYYPPLFSGERADQSRIVLFTLTGEKMSNWGNKTYTLISTGANGSSYYSSSTGEYLFAPSLTLTNSHLYYVCGTNSYSSNEYYQWRQHWVYRFTVDSSGTLGSLLTSPAADSQWTNSYGNPLQLPMQRFTQFAYGYTYSSGTYIYRYSYSDYYTLTSDGYGIHEGSSAPMPFRVSANGQHCAIVAGPSTMNSSGTNLWSTHVWVDSGSGPYRISTTARHILWGAARGSRLTCGPSTSYNYQWGKRTGPSSQLEIADNGSRVAVVVNQYASSISYSSSGYEWGYAREDVYTYEQSNGSNWSGGADETNITASTFASPILWKFGALVFTADNDGLVFWGGGQSYDPDLQSSTYYYDSYSYCGSLYAYDFSTGQVIHILPNTHGGMSDTVGTRYPADKTAVNPTIGASYAANRAMGTVKPIQGFMSPNRHFYYLMNTGALNSDKQEDTRLVAINVRSLDSSQDINTNADGRAFALTWPSRRSMGPRYGYSTTYIMYYGTSYSPSMNQYSPHSIYGSMQTMSESGRVFFGAHYLVFGPSASASQAYGGPVEATYHGCSGVYAGQVASFDANLAGPVELLTSLAETLTPNNYNSTTSRSMKYLEAMDNGRACAFVYAPQAGGSYYYYPINVSAERLGAVFNIQASSTGSVTSKTVAQDVIGSNARVSSSVTFDSLGTKVFYGASNGGDENGKYLYDVTLSSASPTPKKYTFANDPKRYNALHAGR